MALGELLTPSVPHPRSPPRLSPRALPGATPPHRRLQVELKLSSALHTLDCAMFLKNVKGDLELETHHCDGATARVRVLPGMGTRAISGWPPTHWSAAAPTKTKVTILILARNRWRRMRSPPAAQRLLWIATEP